MNNPFVDRFAIPLLIALVVILGLVALGAETYWLTVVLIAAGAFIGIFLPDIEYIIDAYILGTDNEANQALKQVYKTQGLKGAVQFLNENEFKFQQMPMRSVLFVVLLLLFCYYVIIINAWILGQAMMLSMAASMLYFQIIELAKYHSLKRWFWIYKGDLTSRGYWIYLATITIILAFTFAFV